MEPLSIKDLNKRTRVAAVADFNRESKRDILRANIFFICFVVFMIGFILGWLGGIIQTENIYFGG